MNSHGAQSSVASNSALPDAQSRAGRCARQCDAFHRDVFAHVADRELKFVQQFALDDQHLPLGAAGVGIVAQAVIGNRFDGGSTTFIGSPSAGLSWR